MPNKGFKHSQESKDKISRALSGKKHWGYKDGRQKPCTVCGKIITAPYPRMCRDCYVNSLRGIKKEGFINIGKTRFKKGMTPWNKGTIPFNERKRIASQNRRHAGGIKLTRQMVQMVYEDNIKKYGTLTCIYCSKKIVFGDDTLEHKTPISRGGTNEYINLAVACHQCNSGKRNKTEKEYRDAKHLI